MRPLNAAFLAVDPTPARAGELAQVWRSLGRGDVFGSGRMATSVLAAAVRREDHLFGDFSQTPRLLQAGYAAGRLAVERELSTLPQQRAEVAALPERIVALPV